MFDSVLEWIELLEREVRYMLDGWRGVEEGGEEFEGHLRTVVCGEGEFLSSHLIAEFSTHLWFCYRTVLWR